MDVKALIARQGIPRAGGFSKVPWVPVSADGGFVKDGKYIFYGSKAANPGKDDAQVLDVGSNIDNFVNRLPGNSLILNSVPSGNDEDTIQFDKSDVLATWMSNIDEEGIFKLTLKKDPDPKKGPWDVRAFSFQFTNPWNVTFSSREGALRFSFESFIQGPDPAVLVPVPGLEPDGAMLYFGLDPEKTPKDLTSTIKELFDFSGSLLGPNPIIADWRVTLKLQSSKSKSPSDSSTEGTGAAGKRNGLWICPTKAFQTTVRLQFSISDEDKKTFNELIGGVDGPLKGFTLGSLDVICKRITVLGDLNAGTKAVSRGQVMFIAQCKISSDGIDIPVIASVEFYAFSYNIIIQLNSKDAFQGILLWLTRLVLGLDLTFIRTFLLDSDIFKDQGVYPREINLTLDCDSNGRNTELANFSFDIEVKAGFGETPPETPGASPATPVFLISYSWSRGGLKYGSISGRLWNWFDNSSLLNMQPGYEITANLIPLTETPAMTLNLLTMIPGMPIENVPDTIPTQLSRAYINLSDSGVGLGGTVKSKAVDVINPPPVPQLDLGVINLDASFAWKGEKDFHLNASFMAEMRPSPTSVHQEIAILTGRVKYDKSSSTWLLTASLDSLYASTLYEFFNPSAADHVMPLIESIGIQSLSLTYNYAPVEVQPAQGGNGKKVTKVMGSHFQLLGVLVAAGLQLDLNFNHKSDGTFDFIAKLSPSKESASVGDVIKGILGNDDLELPNFLDEIMFGKDGKDAIVMNVGKHVDIPKEGPKPGEKPDTTVATLEGTKKGSFQFVATVNVGKLSFSFVQIHRLEWKPEIPSKRFFKAALTAVPEIDVPLVGNITQPFEEMYFMWIQDDTKTNKGGDAGLTRKDLASLDKTLPLTVKDKFKEHNDDDLLMSAGSHFGIIFKDSEGKSTCILDYDFKKKTSSTPEKKKVGEKSVAASDLAVAPVDEKEPEKKEPKDDSDGGSASAPLKKKAGPLSISNISLKYVDNVLKIGFNATFELGPLGFSLLGFTINLKLTSLDLSEIEIPTFSLEGFSVVFERPPLTIAGIVRRGDTDKLTYYAGGLIIGWVPYQVQAAGFYGFAHPGGGVNDFYSVFVFARLDGPLVTLEFAEISGVTGGFGYRSEVRIPKANEITEFPFINQSQLDGSSGDVLKTLEALTNPDSTAGGWFSPEPDSYWAAAGMKIDAFQMISLDAVMVVMFGESIKLGIYAVALVNIPNAKSTVKFAHVELGIGVTVDFAYGTLKTEGQLSPKSFILDPNCHLTGGFALYYWFDAPHADRSNVGNFVFTLGGYHQAFRIPEGWPNPPRLGISWSIGNNLSISGEAYFAITPKVCMGGGRLHAAFSAGPITAWFDAFANFLINYKPFSFEANAGICVGVRFNIDILFIHTHISVELSADLDLWGPPLAGRVHIDIKVTKFDINFGPGRSVEPEVDILGFYRLVLQADSQMKKKAVEAKEEDVGLLTEADADILVQPLDEGHTLLATSGLLNNNASTDRSQNEDWVVRGGSFSFVIGCKMAAQEAKLIDEKNTTLNSVKSEGAAICSKPMHLDTAMRLSELRVEITQDGVSHGAVWGMVQQYKQVPTGLWGPYSEGQDPTRSSDKNNIKDLLDDNEGSVKLMMGVLLLGPPAVMSEDTLKAFDILDAGLLDITGQKFPNEEWSDAKWEPEKPKEGAEQWGIVHEKWKSPDWNDNKTKDVQTSFVDMWASKFGWGDALSGLGKIPKFLDERFNDLYVGAPLVTK